MTTAMPSRYHALDSLRGTMMLLGIYLHVSCAYCNLPDVWWFRDTQRSVGFDVTLLYIHLFRMPVFMVMAGFFSALLVGKCGVGGFLRNRGLRIGVPLVAGVLLLYPLLWLLGRYGRALGQPDAWGIAWQAFLTGRWLQYMDTTHLWFLNYLLYLYLIAVALRWAAAPWAGVVSRWFGRVLESKLRWVLWPALTFLTLCTMKMGLLDTENDWIPVPNILLAYSVFFGFGWLLYTHREKMESWSRRAWTQVLLTLPFAALNVYFVDRQMQNRATVDWIGFYGTAATGAVTVWLMVFGCTGLFLRYLSSESPRWRYLSDSAYWQYIMHSPVVLSFQLLFAPLALSAVVKCAAVTILSAVVLLLTYDLLARASWVGVLLNGRRYPRALTLRRASRQPALATASSAPLDPAS